MLLNSYGQPYLGSQADTERENWLYYEGEHWPYWIGPKVPEDSPDAIRTNNELAKIFQQANFISQCVDYYANTLLSKEPEWSLTPVNDPKLGPPPQTQLDEAEKILTAWIDAIKPQFLDSKGSVNGDPFLAMAIHLLVYGRAYLRVYQPEYLATRPEPYRRIMLQAPNPSAVVTTRDKTGVLTKVVYNYAEGGREEQTLDYKTGKTTISVYEQGKANPSAQVVLDLGWRYTIIEVVRKPLINKSMKRLQNSVNLALTMKSRNTVQAGFLERVLLNAQPPGIWERGLDGKPMFIPQPLSIGPGATAFVSGFTLEDEAGNVTGVTNPSISYRDPVDPETFIKSIDSDKGLIYLEADLGHLLVSGDGSLSGVSRKTLKDNYVSRAMSLGQPCAFAISEVYSVVLALLAGVPDRYKVVCQLYYNFGQPLPEEQDLVIKSNAAGLMSRTTAMKRLGIEDPDAEWELIKREREEELKLGNQPVGDELGDKPQPGNKDGEEPDNKEGDKVDPRIEPDLERVDGSVNNRPTGNQAGGKANG